MGEEVASALQIYGRIRKGQEGLLIDIRPSLGGAIPPKAVVQVLN